MENLSETFQSSLKKKESLLISNVFVVLVQPPRHVVSDNSNLNGGNSILELDALILEFVNGHNIVGV